MCLICVPTGKKKKKKKPQNEKNYLKPNRRKLPENKDLNVSKKSTYFRGGIYGTE